MQFGCRRCGRKKLGISHAKLREVLRQDFVDCPPTRDSYQLAGRVSTEKRKNRTSPWLTSRTHNWARSDGPKGSDAVNVICGSPRVVSSAKVVPKVYPLGRIRLTG
jgi:hypothetical protein